MSRPTLTCKSVGASAASEVDKRQVLVHVYICRRIFYPQQDVTYGKYLTTLRRCIMRGIHLDKVHELDPRVVADLTAANQLVNSEFDSLMDEALRSGDANDTLTLEPDPCPIARTLLDPATTGSEADRVGPTEDIATLLQRHGYFQPHTTGGTTTRAVSTSGAAPTVQR